jgi:hypothetical protein
MMPGKSLVRTSGVNGPLPALLIRRRRLLVTHGDNITVTSHHFQVSVHCNEE